MSGANVDGLLSALARVTEEVQERAVAARKGVEHHSFKPYHRYRESLDEHGALVSVIENRIAELPPDKKARIRQQLLAIRRKMLQISIRAAFRVFFSLSAFKSFPLGVREVFAQELKNLMAAQKELRSPDHAGKLPDDLEGDLQVAEMILREILDRAPGLTDFGPRS